MSISSQDGIIEIRIEYSQDEKLGALEHELGGGQKKEEREGQKQEGEVMRRWQE